MDNELYRILEEIKLEIASENTDGIKYLGTISREEDTPNRKGSSDERCYCRRRYNS